MGSWDCFNDGVRALEAEGNFLLYHSGLFRGVCQTQRRVCIWTGLWSTWASGSAQNPAPRVPQGFLAAGIAPGVSQRCPLSLEASMMALSTSLASESRWDVPQVCLRAVTSAVPKGNRVKRQTEGASRFQCGQDTRMASFLIEHVHRVLRGQVVQPPLSYSLHFIAFPSFLKRWPGPLSGQWRKGLLLRKAHSSIPNAVVRAEFLYFHRKINQVGLYCPSF